MNRLNLRLALALVAACSGAREPKLPSLRASFTAYDQVRVTWDAVDPSFTNLVVAVNAGTYPAGSQSVPPGALAATVDLTDGTGITELQVRMTGEAHGKPYSSDVVTIKRGNYQSLLRCDPGVFCMPGPAGFRLYWLKESSANRYVLRRQIYWPDESATGYTTIADVRGDGPFEVLDSDLSAWTDGAAYAYELVAYLDDEPGEATWASSQPALLNAPVVNGGSTSEGVVLTIANRSKYASAVEVFRRSAADQYDTLIADAQMPPGWTEARFLDPAVPAGAYLYQVVAAIGTAYVRVRSSAPVRQWEVMPESGPGTLAASKANLVPGIFAARAPGGGFAVVSNLLRYDQTPQTGSAIVPDATDGSHALNLPAPRSVSRVAVDASGQPHALYVDDPDSLDASPVPIVHTWFDGQSWQSETVATEVTTQNTTAFDIGVDGTLHAAWIGPFTNGAVVVGVATFSGGAWNVDPSINDLPAIRLGQWGTVYVSGDETGAPHLLLSDLGSSSIVLHLFRDHAGQWQSESVPNPAYFETPLALAAAGGRVTVVTQLPDHLPDRTLAIFERTASGWSDPIPLATDVGFLPFVARSADGSRVAIAAPRHSYDAQHSGTLWIREADGTTTTYGMLTSPGPVSTGFSADGKAWVLQWLEDGSNWPPGPPTPALLLEER